MKAFGLEQALCLLDALDKAGVRMLSLGVMIGFPDDTMRDIEDTVEGMRAVERAIRSLNSQRLTRAIPPLETHWDIMIYMLLPGTHDFRRHRGRVLFGDDYERAPELLTFQTAAYWPEHFTPWELTAIRAEIARDFGGIEEAVDETACTQHRYDVVG